MIAITGAGGFIGSCLTGFLNRQGREDLLLVDDFSRKDKLANLQAKRFVQKMERAQFPAWLNAHANEIEFLFHIGARTDTTETSKAIFDELNLDYSKKIWRACAEFDIPLVYASSAATYGSGRLGFTDDHQLVEKLHPLNPYGESKNEFDKWALEQQSAPSFWAGLKFFNVYGPNEYHKGRMASVVYHAFRQIQESGKVRLFRSHRPDFKDGEQARDFIYVMDVLRVCHFMFQDRPASGLYNAGTGKARTFLDLAHSLFAALDQTPVIEFIDTPEDIRDTYQYFTEANRTKLLNAGYPANFTSLENGVDEYVNRFLKRGSYY